MRLPETIETLGAIAGFPTTFAFVPQLIKIQKQGGCDLSSGMLIFYLTGVFLWLSYGIFLHAPSVILANAATSFLIVLAIFLKRGKSAARTLPLSSHNIFLNAADPRLGSP